MADEMDAVDLESRNRFDLMGELWKNRTPADDLDICLRPVETANGLRRMNAISVDGSYVDKVMKCKGRQKEKCYEARTRGDVLVLS